MNAYSYLAPGAAKYEGEADYYADFVTKRQLKDVGLWEHFVEVFRTRPDGKNQGWRGEYFGKMMRGACLTYRYTANEALYAVLEDAVRDLLTTQDDLGRISTYTVDSEFTGWDMWGRKYVLTSLLHFREICKDETLKEEILTALCRHADYIAAAFKDGKRDITKGSRYWGGVNSCSVLEPIVALYKETGRENYLEFARYIISTGGCSASYPDPLHGGCKEGSLIDFALENRPPWDYPEVKAYETMSFFEGLLGYFEVTGEEKYFTAVKNFVRGVAEEDLTLIGCSGCFHEQFDNSSKKQTDYASWIMQETCVSVTWMRLLARLHLLTGEAAYAELLEKTAYNAMFGAVNDHMLPSVNEQGKVLPIPLPFDSYSPLFNNVRGRGVGGLQYFGDKTYYGCCACIGAAGIGLFPLSATLAAEGGLVLDQYLSGTVRGEGLTLTVNSAYPAFGRVSIGVSGEGILTLRIPTFAQNVSVRKNTEVLRPEEEYLTLSVSDGDTVTLTFDMEVTEHVLNGRTAFTYGPLVLARAQSLEGGRDLSLPLHARRQGGKAVLRRDKEENGETVRFRLLTEEGEIPLANYAALGKRWDKDDRRMTVWMDLL